MRRDDSPPANERAGPLARAAALIEAGRERGLHPGAQLYVSRDGQVVADAAFGEQRAGAALRRDDLIAWMSASKPVTAVALGRLWERGLLALDDPIARHLPAFAAHGKAAITLRHALTHTGGFRMLRLGWPDADWDEIIAGICARRPEPKAVPGEKAAYHLAASWFILGAVVERLAGRPFAEVVRDEIFEPLGMTDCWIGMPAARYHQYVAADRLATAWDTAAEGAPRPLGWESEARAVTPSPAGGGRGPMRQLGRFYETLLAGGTSPATGARLLRPQTVEALTARHRVGMLDHTFKQVMDWGLGFIPDSKHYGDGVPYAYGRHCSPRTFGHGGYRSTTAFADPEHRLVVAVGFSGLPDEATHGRRMRAVLEAIYEDLGLAGG